MKINEQLSKLEAHFGHFWTIYENLHLKNCDSTKVFNLKPNEYHFIDETLRPKTYNFIIFSHICWIFYVPVGSGFNQELN